MVWNAQMVDPVYVTLYLMLFSISPSIGFPHPFFTNNIIHMPIAASIMARSIIIILFFLLSIIIVIAPHLLIIGHTLHFLNFAGRSNNYKKD
jgi:hypothetical protein